MSKADRLSVRIDPLMKRWAMAYARRCNTTLTKLITDHLLKLKKDDDRIGQDKLEQL